MEFRVSPDTITRLRRSYLAWALVCTSIWALLCIAFAPDPGRPPIHRLLTYSPILMVIFACLGISYRAMAVSHRERRLSVENGYILISFRDNQAKAPLTELQKIVLYGPKGKTNYIKLVRPHSMKILISGYENMEGIAGLIANQYPNVPTKRWRWRAF